MRKCLEHCWGCFGFDTLILFFKDKDALSCLLICDHDCPLTQLQKHYYIVKTQTKDTRRTKNRTESWPICYLLNPVTRAPVDITRCSGVSCCHAVCNHEGEHYHQVQPHLSHLDGRLFVDAEQEDVRHTDEGPFLIGPEHNDGSSLRRLCCNIKVGEANASQVGGQTNKNVPVRAWG